MILLVPLNRYYVEYEVGVGQPYSELHTLILRSTAETEGISIEMLQELFGLPSRLLIEILITLFKEGWIAVSLKTGGGFEITAQGREALESNRPPQMRRIETRPGSILMERLTGMLIPQNEISNSYESKRALKESGTWDDAYQLASEFDEDTVDEGQVQSLLRRNKREWIRHIKPPELRQKNWYYLPVDVNLDPAQMQITGVPERWRAHLEPLLLELAAECAEKSPSLLDKNYWARRRAPDRSRDESATLGWQTEVHPDHLLLTSRQHTEQLEEALLRAKSTVLIASGAVDVNHLARVPRPLLLKAIERGVHVSMLWGNMVGGDAQETSFVDSLEAVAGDLGAAVTKGLLSANMFPTNSHVSLLIYDMEDGFRAYVGSYDWLVAPAINTGDGHATVFLNHPGVVAELCRSVAALFMTGHGNRASSSPDRWRRIAEELDEIAVTLPETAATTEGTHQCTIQILRDQKHVALLSECLLSAQSRCGVLSRHLGLGALRRLSPLKRREDRALSLVVRYRETHHLTAKDIEEIESLVRDAGGNLQLQETLLANAVVADTTAIIGSYPLLLGSSLERRALAHELGVLIDGGEIADKLWAVFFDSSAKI